MTCVEIFTQLEKLSSFRKNERVYRFVKFVKSVSESKISECLTEFLYFIDKLSSERYLAYSKFIETIKGMTVIEDKFDDLLNLLNKWHSYSVYGTNGIRIWDSYIFVNGIRIFINSEPFSAFSHLFKAIKGRKELITSKLSFIESSFISFLNTIPLGKNGRYPITEGDKRILSFSILIEAVKNTQLFSKLFSLINEKMILVISILKRGGARDKYNDIDALVLRYNEFSSLVQAVKGTELINTFYEQIETRFNYLLNGLSEIYRKNKWVLEETIFPDMIEAIKGTDLIKNNFTDILESIDLFIQDDKLKSEAFSTLINAIKGTNVIKEVYPDIIRALEKLPGECFCELLGALAGTTLMEEKFTELLIFYHSMLYNEIRRSSLKKVFFELVNAVWGTKTINTYFSLLKAEYNQLKKLEGVRPSEQFNELEKLFLKENWSSH